MNNLMKLMMAGLISITTIGVSQNITTPQTTVNQQTKQAEVVVEETSKTLQEAKQIALNYVNGTITKTKEDNDDYTIYVKKDNYLYEIEVNKKTGKIEEVDKEKIKTTSSNITLSQAKELALKEVNGTIISTKRDDDDYEITIQKDNYTYEIEVSKKTGKITDIDKEKVATTVNIISKSKA